MLRDILSDFRKFCSTCAMLVLFFYVDYFNNAWTLCDNIDVA